jgi:hypothetical protein
VRYARGDRGRDGNRVAIPVELSTASDLQRWGVLPAGGGLRDQDYRHFRRVSLAWDTYHVLLAYEAAEDRTAWRQEHSEQADWIDTVMTVIGDLAYGDD